ncbi:MAG: PKD domain-containing protein, partial [ANME-2 cluster archaeon]|nr:PKD domain-containing protein [ANME-2 cluster archaeon]
PTSSTITLDWIAPGDDGISGTAKLYDVRYSTSNIETDADWEAATQATGEPKPQSSGSAETYTVTGLSYNTNYYFAVKAIDNVGNPSLLSNVISENTEDLIIIFYDDMEHGTNGWTHSGSGDNWELGPPTSGPNSAYSEPNTWATNLDGNYDINYMNARLVSPPVDLSGIISTQLTFMHYYFTESYYDGGIVEISTDGGSSWVQITPVGGYPEDALSSYNPLGQVPAYSSNYGYGWHQQVFDLSDYNGYSNVRVGFSFGTDYSVNSYPGWYIDDVTVLGDSGESNSPPIANAGGPYSGTEDTAISFDGSGSSDTDGSIVSYNWNFGDTNTGTGVSPKHTYAQNGSYTVTLTVTDNDGATDTSTTMATIGDIDPVADFTATPTSGPEPLTVSFSDTSTSYDGITAWEWDFENDTVIDDTTPNPSHMYSIDGVYTVTLTVYEADGDSQTDTKTDFIVVSNLNQPPTSDPNGPYTGTEGLAITFNGSGSSDPDGSIVSYDWNFGDTNTGTRVNPTHTYAQNGTYTVTLMVTDEDGATDTSTTTATITEATSLEMHVHSINMSTKTRGKKTKAIATATVTILDAYNNKVVGATVSGHWDGLTSDSDVRITDINGAVSLKSNKVKRASGTFTFIVDDVTHSVFTYNASANVEDQGSITVP